MVRLVQWPGIGSFIGATPVALQNALLDTSRRATSTGARLTRTSGLAFWLQSGAGRWQGSQCRPSRLHGPAISP
jgi:hypothetical protein